MKYLIPITLALILIPGVQALIQPNIAPYGIYVLDEAFHVQNNGSGTHINATLGNNSDWNTDEYHICQDLSGECYSYRHFPYYTNNSAGSNMSNTFTYNDVVYQIRFYPTLGGFQELNISLHQYCKDMAAIVGHYEIFVQMTHDSGSGGDFSIHCMKQGGWETLWTDGAGTGVPRLVEDAMWYNVSYLNASQNCNQTYENRTKCGGPNFQLVLNCTNKDGAYDWHENRTFCPYGCINGTCYDLDDSCIDKCVVNSSICSLGYQYNCTTNSQGCLDWDLTTANHCEFGCLNGRCLEYVDACVTNEFLCVDGNIYECIAIDGINYWNKTTDCEYGCIYTYTDFNITGSQCTTVGDAHQIQNALIDLGSGISFIFQPIFVLFYIFAVIVFSIFIGKKISNDENVIIYTFLLLISMGYFFGLPIYIIIVIVIPTLFILMKRG